VCVGGGEGAGEGKEEQSPRRWRIGCLYRNEWFIYWHVTLPLSLAVVVVALFLHFCALSFVQSADTHTHVHTWNFFLGVFFFFTRSFYTATAVVIAGLYSPVCASFLSLFSPSCEYRHDCASVKRGVLFFCARLFACACWGRQRSSVPLRRFVSFCRKARSTSGRKAQKKSKGVHLLRCVP
jgi:hypothetical protein